MVDFTSYGATISVPEKYAEGHVVNAAEAEALNGRMAEFISHRVRAHVFSDLAKGDTASPELTEKAQAFVNELAPKFAFDMAREGGTRITDPVQREARTLAAAFVLAKIAKSGQYPNGVQKRGKAGEEDTPLGEGQYPIERFREKVSEAMKLESIQTKAKRIAKAKAGEAAVDGGDSVEI